jgi:hypothetical protein
VPGALTETGAQGTDRFTFTGQIGGRKLPAGSYLLTATPNANGHAVNPATTTFAIAG